MTKIVGPAFTYRAKLIRVIDGDTLEVDIDLGFHLSQRAHVRLFGIDASELRSKDSLEVEKAKAAKEAVIRMLAKPELVIITEKADSFGRWLAYVWYTDEFGVQQYLNVNLIKDGYAIPYKR